MSQSGTSVPETSAQPAHGVELALLGLLRRNPTHAYEIYQALQTTEALCVVWTLKEGNLYAHLNKLEGAGYIESTLEPQGARPPRKMLRLTAAGDAALRQLLETPVKHGRDFRLEFLAKLAIAVEQSEQAVATLLERQRKACRAWVTELSQELWAVPSDRQFERLVLEFRLSQLRAINAWLRTCEQTLAPSHEQPHTTVRRRTVHSS